MSDCESDSVELYAAYLETFCERVTRVYEGPLRSATINELVEADGENRDFAATALRAVSNFVEIPWRFFAEELKFSVHCYDLIKRLSRMGEEMKAVFSDYEADFIWLLFLTQNYSKLRRVHSASGKLKGQLIVFVDGNGDIYDHGIQFLNCPRYRGIRVLDGDADILVGVGKKRGYSLGELERGQPFVVGGELLHNGKSFKWSWYSQL